MDDLTKNFFYNKNVIVYQGKKGYRFSVDAPILADFVANSKDKTALEIGCGSGIISLLLIYKNKLKYIYCYEIQKRLSDIANLNLRENKFEKRIKIINSNFMIETGQGLDFNKQKFDIVFSNPPFYTVKKGRVSSNQETAIAKFELKITLSALLEKVRSILSKNGDFFLILPYDRLDETRKLSKDFGYSIVKKRNILSFAGGKEERFLIQLANNMDDKISFTEEEPLIIFKEKGVYTDEMKEILGMNL